jgi:hypothetical protein
MSAGVSGLDRLPVVPSVAGVTDRLAFSIRIFDRRLAARSDRT